MDNEFKTGRYAIPSPQSDDDAGSAYQALEENRADAELMRWMDEDGAAPSSEPVKQGQDQSDLNASELLDDIPDGNAPDAQNAPDGAPKPKPDDKPAGWQEVASAVISDVGEGMTEAPVQVVGGFMEAVNEAGQFLDDLLPNPPALQITDPETGEFDPKFMDAEALKVFEEAGGQDIFEAMIPEEADTVTGNFVRSTSQFLAGFMPAMAATKGIKGGMIVQSMVSGAIADAVVFDPNEDRLSTWLNEVPALEPFVSDYMADNNPDNQSDWEGRFKNALEGAGIGIAAEGGVALFKALKYYKAQRNLKKQEDPVGAAAEAGRDAFKEAAREELVQDVADDELIGLGDPNGPSFVEAMADETAATAFERVKNASARSEAAVANGDALARINEISETFAQRSTAKGGADPVDDLIDAVRSGAGNPENFKAGGKRPAASVVKALGGIDPKSSIAAELKARGISAKTHPGMFKKGGLGALDNIPVSEQPIFQARNVDDGNGYIPEQEWLNALESEARGEPWRTAENQVEFDEFIAPVNDFAEQLDQMGIDVSELSNASVKARIKQIEDEAEAFAIVQEGGIRPGDPDIDPPMVLDEATGEMVPAPTKIYINHARLQTGDDIKQVLQELADADADAINAAKGGKVVSNAQTKEASKKEYQEISDLIGRDPGPMTASQSLAARELLVASGEQIVQLAKRAQASDASKADIYNFRRGMAVHYAIQSEVISARAETARALQAWAIPAGAGKIRAQTINDLIVQNGGGGELQNLAKAIASVGDNQTALNTMARELGKGRFGRAMYQVWINGLLSSPKTHAVNIMSNSMVGLWAIPERYLAAGISKAFYEGELRTGEVAAQAFGMVKGIRDGIRLVFMGNKAEGSTDLGDVFDAFGKVENHGNDFSAEAFGLDVDGAFGRGIDMLGKVVNAPGSMLQVEDKFFKSIGYRMELNALAYRTAAGEGLEGEDLASRVHDILSNPPENLKAEALDVAAYQTFTKELGDMGQSFQKLVRKVPGLKVVVPFIRTPTNILKYTLERTPLAYASGKIRADIKAGGARAAQAHARVALGAMAMLSVVDMTGEGTITGRGPLDPKLRRAKMDLGWMPYSLKINGRWYQYSRTDPIGMIIGLGADMAEITSDANDEGGDMIAVAGVMALANNLASKTYTQGLFEFIAAMDNRNPTSDPGKYLTGLAGSIMPFSSFLRNITNANDTIIRDDRNVIRNDEGEVDEIASYLDELVNKQKKMIPGLSDTLPPRRDLYGKEINRASGIGWGWDFVSPIASRVDDPDPVTQAILDNKIKISNVPRVVEGVELNAEEYSEFARLAGEPLKEELDRIVGSPGFKRMSDGPDGMKAQIILDAVNRHRNIARARIMQEFPRLIEYSFNKKLKKVRNLQGEK